MILFSISAFAAVLCLFMSLIYGYWRLSNLHAYRAKVQVALAKGDTGTIDVLRPPEWLSNVQGVLVVLGTSALLFALFLVLAY